MSDEGECIALAHNQRIRLCNDIYEPDTRVLTIEGFCSGYGDDAAEAIAAAVECGYPLAWTCTAASVLVSDYPGKREDILRSSVQYRESPLVRDGAPVAIEGRFYRAVYTRTGVSNPVRFEPAGGMPSAAVSQN